MKREVKLFISLSFVCMFAFILISISFISASFSFVNSSSNIQTKYGPGEILKGSLNISFTNENINSLITAFDSSKKLVDFLNVNNVNYNCTPIDCETGYITSGSEKSKTFSLGFNESKVIGFKITGGDVSISSFSLNITSNAAESVASQLKIDLLNDNENEWTSNKSSGIYYPVPGSYGCFEPSATLTAVYITNANPYCEKITLPAFPSLKLGADILKDSGAGAGSVQFKFDIYDYEYTDTSLGSCTASASASGQINCIANFSSLDEKDFLVCISTSAAADNSKYKINSESHTSCGFAKSNPELFYDFQIFANPGKYKAFSSFVLNNIDADYLQAYIDERYEGDCTSGCVIPAKIYSGKAQSITLYDLKLGYESPLAQLEDNIYDTSEQSATLSMKHKILDLSKANLAVPTSVGNKTLQLKLNDVLITSKSINVLNVPQIVSIAPTQTGALVETNFYAIIGAGAGNISSYIWNFNGTTRTTSINLVKYSFPDTGTYNLKLTVVNNAGNSTKTQTISVVSPRAYLNSSITSARTKVIKINNFTSKLPVFTKDYINQMLDINNLTSELNSLETRSHGSVSDSEALAIMSDLNALDIPDSVAVTQNISNFKFIPDVSQLDINDLKLTGAFATYNRTADEYNNAVLNWMKDVNIKISSTTYSAIYSSDDVVGLASYIKLSISSPDAVDLFFVVNENINDVRFKDTTNAKSLVSDSTGFSITGVTTKTVELIIPGIISIDSMPIYISPSLSKLEFSMTPVCNNNNECDEGENIFNCRKDCKPTKKMIIYMILLLFAFFVVYIIMQEWYKRHYEKHLFPNRNDLYNVISYMATAYNQGVNKNEFFSQLGNQKWTREQISYSWNKFRGKRTGMWEIPIFKFVENRKVRQELEKKHVAMPRNFYNSRL